MQGKEFKKDELKNNVISPLRNYISNFLGDIVLTFKDNRENAHITEAEFKDYVDAKDVIKIFFINSITITNRNIFDNYKGVISILGEIPIIDTSDLSLLFKDSKLVEGNLNDWDMSGVTNMGGMFIDSQYNLPLNKWDVSNVISMILMFYGSQYNYPLNKWNVSKVTNMRFMFMNSQYNQPLNKWNVSSVINMNNMFKKANYNHPLNSWNVSKVTDMEGIFNVSLYNHPLNNWNISNVTNVIFMFYYSNYNHPLNNWNVSYIFDDDYYIITL